MNPSHTNRLRPRDRVSPGPSPLSSPTLNRRSGSLPVTTLDNQREQDKKLSGKENADILKFERSNKEKASTSGISTTQKHAENSSSQAKEIQDENSHIQQSNAEEVNDKDNQVIKQTRRRSGSWGGAYESEEEIKVAVKLNDEYLDIEENVCSTPQIEDIGVEFNVKYDEQNHMDNSSEASGNKMEEELRRRLAFHFMDPVDKFIARRQVPWKLLLQFLKVILVTAQLLVFGYYRYAHSNYYSDNRIGFSHLFLGDAWDPVREIDTYPPSTGALALYEKEKFYKMFNDTVAAFDKMEAITVNPMFKNSSFMFCIESFKGGGEVSSDLIIPPEMNLQKTKTDCIRINDSALQDFDSHKYLKATNFTVPWDTMNRMHFNFNVTTVTYRRLGTTIGPECFRFGIVILFDNSDHDGQIPISLQTLPERLRCPTADGGENTIESTSVRLLNLSVILVCLVSLILCCRALSRAQKLGEETKKFFIVRLKIHLTFSEMWQFLNLWYVLICINDLLLITGSVITEMLETRKTTGDLWDFCSIFLGTGNLLVWIGMLRYLGFFATYNALILTLKGAFPNVARFVICAGLVYSGYTFCGWIVFAPYHFKFRTLGSTSECLFSLINGDDMFATFSMLPQKLGVVHGFSRLFLYSFVMLFIYVVLSLFIAIIMDTYENIKEYYKAGFPRSRVDDFYMAIQYDPYSDLFFDGSKPSYLYNCWAKLMLRYYGQYWKGFKRHSNSNSRQFNNSATNSSYLEESEIISNEELQITDIVNQSHVLDEGKLSNHIETTNSSSNVDSSIRSNDKTPLLQ